MQYKNDENKFQKRKKNPTQACIVERINRETYLNALAKKRENGLIKIISGIRRCGKSCLLDPIFKDYLLENGVREDHIIKLDLDERRNRKYLDPDVLDGYIRGSIKDDKMYYILLDEVQKVDDFESVLNGFLNIGNADKRRYLSHGQQF